MRPIFPPKNTPGPTALPCSFFYRTPDKHNCRAYEKTLSSFQRAVRPGPPPSSRKRPRMPVLVPAEPRATLPWRRHVAAAVAHDA